MTDRIVSKFGAFTSASEVAAGHDLTGVTAIVTGGASGIGFETAKSSRGPKPRVEGLDLANLASIRAFAGRWARTPLHLLIHNAGVMACPQAYTGDGFETQFGTNHLGHFLLAHQLTPALMDGAQAQGLRPVLDG